MARGLDSGERDDAVGGSCRRRLRRRDHGRRPRDDDELPADGQGRPGEVRCGEQEQGDPRRPHDQVRLDRRRPGNARRRARRDPRARRAGRRLRRRSRGQRLQRTRTDDLPQLQAGPGRRLGDPAGHVHEGPEDGLLLRDHRLPRRTARVLVLHRHDPGHDDPVEGPGQAQVHRVRVRELLDLGAGVRPDRGCLQGSRLQGAVRRGRAAARRARATTHRSSRRCWPGTRRQSTC